MHCPQPPKGPSDGAAVISGDGYRFKVVSGTSVDVYLLSDFQVAFRRWGRRCCFE
jgi:hypothetical protein